jgi:hypothetical protein
MILEIAKHLNPVDYINLYITNNSLKNTLSMDYNKVKTEYWRIKFHELFRYYVQEINALSVYSFDYFAEDNSVCYDGKTPPFKALYKYVYKKKWTLIHIANI